MNEPADPAAATNDAGDDGTYGGRLRVCAWPRRPQNQDPARVRLITPEELTSWVLDEDEDVLALNKPGDVVCHPSKAGPWSSLAGAVKAGRNLEKAHLIFRLDRETSGVVLFAKNERAASRLQKAMQERRIRKTYRTVLVGELRAPIAVDQPLGDDERSPVFIKTTVRPDGKFARSLFYPLALGGGFTFAEVRIETGRKHQIRAHAQWLGYPVVGDKIYGPDARCYLEFIDHGWTPALAERLLLERQALHCAEIQLEGNAEGLGARQWTAPMAPDLTEFLRVHSVKNAPGRSAQQASEMDSTVDPTRPHADGRTPRA
ncbi:MAG: RNA pseudouridine synthase [Verrucomicrobia bacterium]|nr:MAG: RNA pseudouridine synthase [Verrucomicrobiota bacterium]